MIPRFIMLIGPSGAGKTTYAHQLQILTHAYDHRVVVLSSDAIREEIYGDANEQKNPAKVFKIMDGRTLRELDQGNTVIYDATNLNKERRVNLLKKIRDRASHYIVCEAHYFTTPLGQCIERQTQRERQVPDEVIQRHFNQYEAPTYAEGWDHIVRI